MKRKEIVEEVLCSLQDARNRLNDAGGLLGSSRFDEVRHTEFISRLRGIRQTYYSVTEGDVARKLLPVLDSNQYIKRVERIQDEVEELMKEFRQWGKEAEDGEE